MISLRNKLKNTINSKLLISLCLLVLLPEAIFAANEFIPLITIEQARNYCPAINALTFTPNNPSIPNSGGSITGYNHYVFESIPIKKAIHPKFMDASGLIQDAQFRSVEGMYGYESNNVVSCFYTYKNFADIPCNLVIRGK